MHTRSSIYQRAPGESERTEDDLWAFRCPQQHEWQHDPVIGRVSEEQGYFQSRFELMYFKCGLLG